MAGWHHQLDGHKFEWTPEVGDGQGGLTYCDSWGYKESDMTEWLNKLNWSNSLCCYLTFPPSDILRAFRPSLHPMYADHTSLFNPCSLLAVVSVRATSQLGVLDRCVICGFFFFFFSPPSYVALWDSKTPYSPARESVSWYFEASPPTQLPSQDVSLSLTLFSLYILYFALPLFKENGLTFWVLLSSTSVQQLFCGICSVFKWSFSEFVGDKVVSRPILLPS